MEVKPVHNTLLVTSWEARMKPLLLACLLLFIQATNVSAQSLDPQEQAQQIKTLTARIDMLEKRLAELEGTKAQATVAPAQQPASAAPAEAEAAMEGMPMTAQGEPSLTHPTLNIAGFSDFNFSATDQPGTKSGFNEGQFILHLNSNLSSKVSYMGELSLTARADANTGTPPAPNFNATLWNAALFDMNTTIVSRSPSAVITRRSITGIPNFTTANGCKTTVSRPGNGAVRRQVHSGSLCGRACRRSDASRRTEPQLQRRRRQRPWFLNQPAGRRLETITTLERGS